MQSCFPQRGSAVASPLRHFAQRAAFTHTHSSGPSPLGDGLRAGPFLAGKRDVLGVFTRRLEIATSEVTHTHPTTGGFCTPLRYGNAFQRAT